MSIGVSLKNSEEYKSATFLSVFKLVVHVCYALGIKSAGDLKYHSDLMAYARRMGRRRQ